LKNNIIFRVESNTNIGVGHLVRCISLADMLAAFFKITFMSVEMPISFANKLINTGYDVFFLESNDEDAFVNMLSRGDIVVIDGYDFRFSLQKKIREKTLKLVIIDDIPSGNYTADIIINHSPNVKSTDYKVINNDCFFALGFDYAMLRNAFIEEARKPRRYKEIDSLLICFGGADKLNLTERALKVAAKFETFKKINVVTGPAYEYADSLMAIMLNDSRFNHYIDVTDEQMKNLMLESDIAILPTSGLLFEAIACKARIIFGMYSNNQKLLYNLIRETKYGIDASYFSEIEISNALQKSLKYPFPSNLLSIDGKSPRRITQLFLQFLITFRHAEFKDAEMLFKWVNDSEVRNNSINKEPVKFNNHIEWYKQKLNTDCTRIYIMEYGGSPVGQVRFDKWKGCWLIDYSVAKEYRGLGFGKILIQRSINLFTNCILLAKVLNSNIASSMVFKSCGFKEEGIEVISSRHYNIFSLHIS
jgi:UDP-2,4-diacetamido-2,4,6-trideoxy-beta-L-altropyranose hydrolase